MHWHAGYNPQSTLNASACRVKGRGSCPREYQGLYLQLLWRSHGWAINLARTSKQGMAREQFCMLWSAGCGSGITLRAVKFRVWLRDNPACCEVQGVAQGQPCLPGNTGLDSRKTLHSRRCRIKEWEGSPRNARAFYLQLLCKVREGANHPARCRAQVGACEPTLHSTACRVEEVKIPL